MRDTAVKRSFDIPSLDGIRAVSILIVFVSHAGLEKFVPGLLGVTVFFFLSGYLITTLLRKEYLETGEIRLGAFYLRRVLRILPPFYLVLAVATLLTYYNAISARDVFGSLRGEAVTHQALHLANYYNIFDGNRGIPAGTEIYWSLSVEEHFYLVFPLMLIALLSMSGSIRIMKNAMLLLCGAILAWRCVLIFGFGHVFDPAGEQWIPVNGEWTKYGTDTRFDAILFGCLLASYGNPIYDRSRFSERAWKYALLPLGLAAILFTLKYRSEDFRQTFRYTIQGLALIPVFVVAVRYSNWLPCRVLNWGPAKFIGAISYSLYLVHYMLIQGVQQRVPVHPILQGAIALALSLGAAYLIFVTVETPMARLRSRLSKRGAKRAAPAPTVVHYRTAIWMPEPAFERPAPVSAAEQRATAPAALAGIENT